MYVGEADGGGEKREASRKEGWNERKEVKGEKKKDGGILTSCNRRPRIPERVTVRSNITRLIKSSKKIQIQPVFGLL